MVLNPPNRIHDGSYLDSECACFIQAILDAKSDEDRTFNLHVFADWLEEKGDPKDYCIWFRHPKLRWEHSEHAHLLSWYVRPEDNKGCGYSSLMSNVWWSCYFPTQEYLLSDDCARLVKAWITNSVIRIDEFPWLHQVAERIGLSSQLNKAIKEQEEHRKLIEESNRRAEERDRVEYERLKKKYEQVK